MSLTNLLGHTVQSANTGAVAVNLAFELSKKGAKVTSSIEIQKMQPSCLYSLLSLEVGIFDCDIYGPSLPVMVKLPVEPELEMYLDEQEQRHIVPLVHPESGCSRRARYQLQTEKSLRVHI
eukprot:5266765-Amphidinium_carterae.3